MSRAAAHEGLQPARDHDSPEPPPSGGYSHRPAVRLPLASAVRAELRRHPVHCRGQRRQVLLDDQPDRPKVNAEIAMHDHVAESGELTPWNLRLGALDLARKALARLGQGLQIADDRVLHKTRGVEPGAFGVGLLEDPVQTVAHVRQQHPVRLGARVHSGTALAKTRSRSAGCRPASVTTSTRRPSNS